MTQIYNLGDETTRQELVDALSATFAGEQPDKSYSSAGVTEEMKSERLPAEFSDNQSTQQKKLLKTYNDLVSVASQLGNKTLIYKFLEVHRHLAHYQDMQSAARGMTNILMLDEKLKANLVKLAPRILLLSYDQNRDVSDTMKELWGNLVDAEEEPKIIAERWTEIYDEASKALSSTDKNQARNKLGAVRALTDLLPNRTWGEIKKHFRMVFLTCIASVDSEKDTMKAACYQLGKTLKRIILKLGNVYTNGDEQELKEVL